MLVDFAQDMFPGVSTEDIGVWPADDGELVWVRGGGTVAANYSAVRNIGYIRSLEEGSN
jgi:hypothetical protein